MAARVVVRTVPQKVAREATRLRDSLHHGDLEIRVAAAMASATSAVEARCVLEVVQRVRVALPIMLVELEERDEVANRREADAHHRRILRLVDERED